MKVKLANQSMAINAPRSQVFQRFASFKKDKPASDTGEGATVLEREGNWSLVEFVSRDGRKLSRTLEEVTLYLAERITLRNLDGPVHHASEEFQLRDVLGAHTSHTGDRSNAARFPARRRRASGDILCSPQVRQDRQTAHGNAQTVAEFAKAGDITKADE